MMATEKRLIDANALDFEPDENCVANGVLVWGGRTGGKTMTTILHALKRMIENAPTVDAVEVVHGQWEQGDYYDFGDVCSNCDWDSERDDCKWSYCPNCGAKMDGGVTDVHP